MQSFLSSIEMYINEAFPMQSNSVFWDVIKRNRYLKADPESSMAKIQAIVVLVGMLFIATLLVDRTTCYVTKSKREEIKVGKSTYEIVKGRIIVSL